VKCEIDGVVIRELTRHGDARGWLVELFRQDELAPELHPAMSYVSLTKPGVGRGPHEHKEQTDHFCFVGSSSFRLYLWDNRSDSPTYGRKCRIDVSEAEAVSILIPPGVVHGYRNTGAVDGVVYNVPNRLYAGVGRKGPIDEIRHEDDPDSPFKLDE
jgi:dTDP-4-dehydrorhamnose 3,5-epimerase